MMIYENLPIYKASMSLCVYIETIVKSFEKYHKYTIGVDLRVSSKEILFMINRANLSKQKRENLILLRDRCEDMKILIHLCKELRAFRSFKQFEYSTKLCIQVCKQAQAWLNVHTKAGVYR